MSFLLCLFSRLKRAASIDTASVFSAFESDDDVISYAGQLDERGDFLTTNNPVEYEEEEEEDEEEEEEEEEQTESKDHSNAPYYKECLNMSNML